MHRKIGKAAIALAIVIAILVGTGQPVHAQSFNIYAKPDRASYVTGDSGTMTLTIVNTGGQPLQLNNITVFWPWAGFGSDGKWQGNQTSTYSGQFLAAPGGTSSSTFTTSFQFTIPSWWGYGQFSPYGCPGGPRTTKVQASSCIILGTAGNPFDGSTFTEAGMAISMAIPTYTPISLVSQAIPIATLVVLAIATVLLGLLWTSSRRTAKKA
jgi:hypothetical protein